MKLILYLPYFDNKPLANVSMLNLDMLTLQSIVFIVFYIFLIKHIKSYIVYIHIGRMLKPLSLPWSHSLITRYVVSPFQVKSQKFLLHLLTILRRFCAIRVLYITVIIIVMCYKAVQLSTLNPPSNGDFQRDIGMHQHLCISR